MQDMQEGSSRYSITGLLIWKPRSKQNKMSSLVVIFFNSYLTGEVVIFLDAHCEVGYNWLPPLLAPIHADRKTLSVPVIDGIQWDDFSINPVYARNSHSR